MAASESDQEWLTPKEVAAHFGVTSETVWRWIKNGALLRVRNTGTDEHPRWRVHRNELKWLGGDSK